MVHCVNDFCLLMAEQSQKKTFVTKSKISTKTIAKKEKKSKRKKQIGVRKKKKKKRVVAKFKKTHFIM